MTKKSNYSAEQIEAINTLVEDIAERTASGPWQDELADAILSKQFNDVQRATLVKNATPSLQVALNKAANASQDDRLGIELSYAVTDPIKKTAHNILSSIYLEQNDLIEKNLVRMKMTMSDVAYNADKLLGGDMPENTRNLIDFYKEKIEDISDILSADIKEPTIEECTQGMDHIHRLPENFQELGL